MTSKLIQQQIQHYEQGELFTTEAFLALGSRAAIDKSLSRLVEQGSIERVARGVFVKPKINRFTGKVLPEVTQVVELIADHNGEVIQLHGAEAARRFKLSTQMPTTPVFYTNGSTRELHIGNRTVKLIHTSNQRKLQHAGSKVGMALSALWYLGKDTVTPSTVEKVRNAMSEEEFMLLQDCKMPAWLASAMSGVNGSVAHG